VESTEPLTNANLSVVLGSAMTAVAGMGFIVLAQRSLGSDEFEAIAHLWTIWSIAGAVAIFAVQQWIILARRSGHVRLARLVDAQLLAALGALALGVLVFTTIFRTDLFDQTSLWWPLAAACIPLGAVAIGLARGLWASRNRFGGLGLIIALENVIRLTVGVVLVLFAASNGWFAGALLLGFLAAAVLPRSDTTGEDGQLDGASKSLLFATALAGLFSHSVINGGPTILAIAGPDDAPVAELFLVLTIARVPLLLAVHGLLPIFAVEFNALVVARQGHAIATLRRKFAIVGVVGAIIVGVIGAFVGPVVADVLFATEGRLGRLEYGLAVALVVLAGAALTANAALVAEARTRYQIAAWAVPVVVGFGIIALLGTPTARSILVTVLIVEACILFAVTQLASLTDPSEDLAPRPSPSM